jgi:mono/diheme cytochrome c family protein
MRQQAVLISIALLLCACAGEPQVRWNPIAGYDELDSVTVIDAPDPLPGNYSPETRGMVERGEYLVELLGCGSCHTDGSFDGAADMERALAGSNTGIAYTNPMGEEHPGVVYPSNITPDESTGIGAWSDSQIADAIRAGIGRHGSRRIATMPWQGYSRLSEDDVDAIVAYLRSIKPVKHEVPDEVKPGYKARYPVVYFGVYRRSN